MRGSRRFSQAISEGESIALLAEVADVDAARTAEVDGAEGVVVDAPVAGVREATELPILWKGVASPPAAAHDAGADAYVLALAELEHDDGRLEREHAEALDLGLDCVVEVRDEDELQLALDRVDPEIVLLSARDVRNGGGMEHVLALLPDVPAGKLAIADLDVWDEDQILELARAGVDAAIVRSPDVARLAASLEA